MQCKYLSTWEWDSIINYISLELSISFLNNCITLLELFFSIFFTETHVGNVILSKSDEATYVNCSLLLDISSVVVDKMVSLLFIVLFNKIFSLLLVLFTTRLFQRASGNWGKVLDWHSHSVFQRSGLSNLKTLKFPSRMKRVYVLSDLKVERCHLSLLPKTKSQTCF